MDVVGSEIGHKMRSAIKAKLTELGCYVDDELPDYVMVMVANKRTRAQMEDDLQLFLGDNTELFVNWLHQVLKKLQEVTVTAPLKPPEKEKSKEKSHSKERKAKGKKEGKKAKEKDKKSDLKKAKKKLKEKAHKKKEIEKPHKSKKSMNQEIIRPNIPPLFRNIEKESEPSITDVFAGQILKNHGISIDTRKEDSIIDKKPIIKEKRPILPIIDPATITTNPEPVEQIPIPAKREEQLLEMNAIENKIQGLKQKLVEQLDSMSDDEDFLNIRTEAEELMNDFAEDVVQEITQQAPINTPPLQPSKLPSPVHSIPNPSTQKSQRSPTKNLLKTPTESLPQIELNLPKRPVRERLGIREEKKKVQEPETRIDSPERFTPDREPGIRPQKSTKTRIEGPTDKEKKKSSSDNGSDEMDNSRKLNSRVSRGKCASVVRVRPRPRVATTTSSLLLKAVADAHKSLLNIPPKTNPEMQKVKRALVLPMRRAIDPQKIIIQIPTSEITHDDRREDSISLSGVSNLDNLSGFQRESNKEEYVPFSITKKITNTDYVPSKRDLRTSTRRDDSLVIETINIHNPTVDKDKSTKFIVTMDGFNPNAFLAKKLQSEGLLNDEETAEELSKTDKKIEKTKDSKLKEKQNAKEDLDLKKKFQRQEKESSTEREKESSTEHKKELSIEHEKEKETQLNTSTIQAKRLSNTSDESDTQVIIKDVSGQRSIKQVEENPTEKRKTLERVKEESPPSKKRKASPIVFNVEKKERVRTESASSENHVITTNSSHKYDSLPPLSQAERKLVWCRAFPLCRYGSSCAFAHPRCKFAAACTRRNCVYSHAPNAVSPTTPAPSVASHVVPAANYKTISNSTPSNICKYYPNCANASCHFYHPKPCRYGKMCTNKVECNFYHADVPAKF